jgi:hypothetical protein
MPKLNSQSSEKYGYNNMRSERIKNIGTPKFGNDAMPWAIPNYTTATRDLLNPETGMLIANISLNKIQAYIGGSWVSLH